LYVFLSASALIIRPAATKATQLLSFNNYTYYFSYSVAECNNIYTTKDPSMSFTETVSAKNARFLPKSKNIHKTIIVI